MFEQENDGAEAQPADGASVCVLVRHVRESDIDNVRPELGVVDLVWIGGEVVQLFGGAVIGEEQLFYAMSRGISEEDASTMVVSGFIEPLVKELPMEYAMEMNRLIALQMEGTVG